MGQLLPNWINGVADRAPAIYSASDKAEIIGLGYYSMTGGRFM